MRTQHPASPGPGSVGRSPRRSLPLRPASLPPASTLRPAAHYSCRGGDLLPSSPFHLPSPYSHYSCRGGDLLPSSPFHLPSPYSHYSCRGGDLLPSSPFHLPSPYSHYSCRGGHLLPSSPFHLPSPYSHYSCRGGHLLPSSPFHLPSPYSRRLPKLLPKGAAPGGVGVGDLAGLEGVLPPRSRGSVIGGMSGRGAATSGSGWVQLNLSKTAIYGGLLSNCSVMDSSHYCPSQLGMSPPPPLGAASDDSTQSYALAGWLLICSQGRPTPYYGDGICRFEGTTCSTTHQ